MIIDFEGSNFTKQDFKFSASQFLSYDLPDDWNEMSEKSFYKWLEEHAWFPYENNEGRQIFLNIFDYAENIRLYVNNNMEESA